jgi:hypothetical protein
LLTRKLHHLLERHALRVEARALAEKGVLKGSSTA